MKGTARETTCLLSQRIMGHTKCAIYFCRLFPDCTSNALLWYGCCFSDESLTVTLWDQRATEFCLPTQPDSTYPHSIVVLFVGCQPARLNSKPAASNPASSFSSSYFFGFSNGDIMRRHVYSYYLLTNRCYSSIWRECLSVVLQSTFQRGSDSIY